MNVSCPHCSTVYRIDPAKVPAGGVRARCSRCSGVIPVGMSLRATPAQPTYRAPPMTPARPIPSATRTPAAGTATQPPQRSTPRAPWPAAESPRQTPVAPSARAAAIPPLEQTQTPVSVPPYTPPPPPPPASTAPADALPSRPLAAPAGRRPINPFLSRDPSLRAKRLARALVSDMVAYYPAKHSEGLERGTLKDLFRDEIKKSYEEYVAQVGAELARGTTHFQEALNEVLGAGRKIF